MSTTSSLRSIGNMHDVYRGKDCMKKFCEFLREDAMKIIVFEKNMKLLTEEQKESYENATNFYICKEKLEKKYLKDKKYYQVRDVAIIQKFPQKFPKEIPIVFHNGSNYGYHFIIKVLVEKFKKQFTCLGESTEKKLQELIKMEKKLQKIYLTFYSLLIAQDSQQAHYQILLIIYLKNFIELNVNENMMIKNVKHVE